MIRITTTQWRGMDAWRLEGPRLSVVVTRIGAQIVAIQAPGTDLNPLWQPPWPSDPSIPSGLLDVICGSNVCLDRFGPTRDDETRPAHGEAGLRFWEQVSEPEVLCVTTALPQAQLSVERRHELRGDVLIIATKVENLSGKTLSFEWAEHPTIGDPFLDGARFTAGVDLATTFPEIEDVRSRFQVPPLSPVDPTLALAMPPASHKEPFGDIVSCRVREGFWKAENPRLGYSLECRWDEAEFPWLCVWTQGRSRTEAPWNGRTRSRGMEPSTKPFPEKRPPPERAERFQDRPTTCILPPATRMDRQFSLRWWKSG